jgi:hypothetical protein
MLSLLHNVTGELRLTDCTGPAAQRQFPSSLSLITYP